jgi:hypothetical protein
VYWIAYFQEFPRIQHLFAILFILAALRQSQCPLAEPVEASTEGKETVLHLIG